MDDRNELEQLRAEVSELRQELAHLQNRINQSDSTAHSRDVQGPTNGPGTVHGRIPRRGLLLGGVGALVGATASVASSVPAAATTGNMQFGAFNSAGTSATVLNSSNAASGTLVLQNTAGGAALNSLGFSGPGATIASTRGTALIAQSNGASSGIEVTSKGIGINVESVANGIEVRSDDGIGITTFGDVGIQAAGTTGAALIGLSGVGAYASSTDSAGLAVRSNNGPPLVIYPSEDVTGLPNSGRWELGSVFCSTDGSLWWCVKSGRYGEASPPMWRLLSSPNAAGAFIPIAPARVFDSRYTSGAPGSPVEPLVAGGARTINVRDSYTPNSSVVALRDVVPAGATAVAVNLTVTGPTAGGYLFLGPGDSAEATASSINWTAPRTTIANGLVAPFGATDRQLKIFTVSSTAGATVQALIDVSGYYLGG